jgi:glycosyltransferase involved in cell wall biosynthesis
LIVVDDFSTDGPRDKLKNMEDLEHVTILYYKRNKGKAGNLRTGFQAATGGIVLIQDADLEYDPSDYPKLLRHILEGKADVVCGSRFAGSESHRVLYF